LSEIPPQVVQNLSIPPSPQATFPTFMVDLDSESGDERVPKCGQAIHLLVASNLL